MSTQRKGKILRLKVGYNPNSSSIGSIIFAIPTMLFISSIIFGTATTFVFSRSVKSPTGGSQNDDEKDIKDPAK